MIFEQRVHQMRHGGAQRYLELMEQGGLEAYQPVLPNLAGYFVGDIGRQDTLITLWRFESYDARTQLRGAVRERQQDPKLKPILREMSDLTTGAETQFLRAAPFSPLR